MAVETFELVYAQLVFGNQNQANSAETAISNFLARPAFRDGDQTIFQVPAGKYGAGPTLLVTARMRDRADADAIWNAAQTRLAQVQAGSFIMQTAVTMDAVSGTSDAVVIHRVTVPALPDDIA